MDVEIKVEAIIKISINDLKDITDVIRIQMERLPIKKYDIIGIRVSE